MSWVKVESVGAITTTDFGIQYEYGDFGMVYEPAEFGLAYEPTIVGWEKLEAEE